MGKRTFPYTCYTVWNCYCFQPLATTKCGRLYVCYIRYRYLRQLTTSIKRTCFYIYYTIRNCYLRQTCTQIKRPAFDACHTAWYRYARYVLAVKKRFFPYVRYTVFYFYRCNLIFVKCFHPRCFCNAPVRHSRVGLNDQLFVGFTQIPVRPGINVARPRRRI